MRHPGTKFKSYTAATGHRSLRRCLHTEILMSYRLAKGVDAMSMLSLVLKSNLACAVQAAISNILSFRISSCVADTSRARGQLESTIRRQHLEIAIRDTFNEPDRATVTISAHKPYSSASRASPWYTSDLMGDETWTEAA